VSSGWFTVNVRDAEWRRHDVFEAAVVFEDRDVPFAELGINIHVLQPGQPNALYHAESAQEDFLVLTGECRLLVEDEERTLRAWDFVHCPAYTAHVLVGAGEEPCAILMVGARQDDWSVVYPVSELARSHGAGVETEVTSAEEAYAAYGSSQPGRPENWEMLPWS
jgi:uncharacterized cupin superfamily protein